MYATIDVIIDGALEETVTYHDEALMTNFLNTIEFEAKDHGYPTEVYVRYHDHDIPDEGEDCACAEMEQDHHPTYSYNVKDEDEEVISQAQQAINEGTSIFDVPRGE